jgi:hypothetical protein
MFRFLGCLALVAGPCLAWPASAGAAQPQQKKGQWLVYYKVAADPFSDTGESDERWKILGQRFNTKKEAEERAAKIRSGQKPQGQKRKVLDVKVRYWDSKQQPPRQPRQQKQQTVQQNQRRHLQRYLRQFAQQQPQLYRRLMQWQQLGWLLS